MTYEALMIHNIVCAIGKLKYFRGCPLYSLPLLIQAKEVELKASRAEIQQVQVSISDSAIPLPCKVWTFHHSTSCKNRQCNWRPVELRPGRFRWANQSSVITMHYTVYCIVFMWSKLQAVLAESQQHRPTLEQAMVSDNPVQANSVAVATELLV